MTKLYKNYIIWTGDNPRLLDIVLSPYNPLGATYTNTAGLWWEDIRRYYADLIGDGNNYHCLITGKEELINDLKACGAIP